MKIVLVTELYDELNNGTTMTAYRLAGALKKRGHEVHVVSSGRLVERDYAVKPQYYPVATYFARREGYGFSRADDEVFRRAFSGADVVHFLLPLHFERRALKIAREMDVPRTAAFHLQPENITYAVHMPWEWLSRALYRHFDRSFYRYFTHVHCPTRFIADRLRENGYGQKLHVVSNGVDEDFTPGPREHETGTFRILMTGRLAPEKRQNVLIDAVAKSRHAESIRLFLAGKGPCAGALARQGSRLKHRPVTGFYGKEDLIRLIRSCDLYVHASCIEIEAISCMEAFSCGLVPVICDSPKSATTRFALDERCLFRPDDSDDLAAKIDYWIEHPEEKAALSGRYIRYAEDFRVDRSAEQMERMFLEAIEEHKSGKGGNP